MLRAEVACFEFIFRAVNYDIVCLLECVIHVLTEDNLAGLLDDVDFIRSNLIIRICIRRCLHRLGKSTQIDRVTICVQCFQGKCCIALTILT